MSNRRIRESVELRFPYGKSALASSALIVAAMLSLAVLADPRSGEIRPPVLAWLLLAGLPAAIATVFYMEFRMRKKRGPVGSRRTDQESRAKRRYKENGAPGKC